MENQRVNPGSVVVGVDGSQHATRAITWAAEQAVLEGRRLTVVHAAGVGDLRTTAWAGVAGAPVLDLPDIVASAREVVREAVAIAEVDHPGLEVVGVPRSGDARHVLVDLSEAAYMVVVGSRGRGTFASMLLGSVATNVAKHARCPVVVTRPGPPGAVTHGVLVGADGTPESLPVIEFAFRQASLRRVPLTVMHAAFDATAAVTGIDGAPAADCTEDLRLLLSETVAGLLEKFPDVPVTLEVGYGLVDQCLTRRTRPRDLIVVGRHPVHTLSKLLASSISTAVLERSDSPVAVVPEAEPAST